MNIQLTGFSDLVKGLQQVKGGVIAVDGVSEKERKDLAEALAVKLKVPVMNGGTATKETIEKNAKKGPVIVEGVVLSETLKKAGLRAAVSVYCIPAQNSPQRRLFDGIVGRDYTELMAELEYRQFDRHIVDYHYSFHPIIHADFIVQGQEKY